MLQELNTLTTIKHQNVMTVVELLEDNDNYYIISEVLAGGELFEKLSSYCFITESMAAIILNKILLAINHMHK